MSARYEIDIDEIVLDGLGVADVKSFRSALVAGLSRLARDHSGEWDGGEAPLLHSESLPDSPAAPSALGVAVARSVWRAIAPPGAPIGQSTGGRGPA